MVIKNFLARNSLFSSLTEKNGDGFGASDREVGKSFVARLHLSSDEQSVREQAKEAERAAYRRLYWQGLGA